MTETINDWTELVSEAQGSDLTVTVEVENEDVWLAKTDGSEPSQPEKGVTGRSNESSVMALRAGKALFARSKTSTPADVRVVPGYAKQNDGRGTVNADLVGTPTVDVSDDQTREVGKVRLNDDSGTLIKDSNPLPVDPDCP